MNYQIFVQKLSDGTAADGKKQYNCNSSNDGSKKIHNSQNRKNVVIFQEAADLTFKVFNKLKKLATNVK